MCRRAPKRVGTAVSKALTRRLAEMVPLTRADRAACGTNQCVDAADPTRLAVLQRWKDERALTRIPLRLTRPVRTSRDHNPQLLRRQMITVASTIAHIGDTRCLRL